MAKAEIKQILQDCKITTVAQAIRILRAAIAEELFAQNLYAEIIDCLRASSAQQQNMLIRRLTEIMRDEMRHVGSLLWLIDQLDHSIKEEMEKGADGE